MSERMDASLVQHALALAEAKWGTARVAGPCVVEAGPRAWFVLITISQGERRAREALEDGGYSVYIPRRVEIIRHHRSKKLIERSFPLFNRYIFVELPTNLAQWWSIVHPIKELVGALGEEGRPRPLDGDLVADIRRREERGVFNDGGRKGELRRAYGQRRFPVGSYARAAVGPFGGFAGRVESVDGKGAVRLLLEIFARATPVDFDPDQLEPV